MKSIVWRLVWALLFSVLLCSPLLLASTSGTITGQVTDPSGAVVVGAALTVRNSANGVSREMATNSRGEYVASMLEPGDYEIAAMVPGYSPTRAKVTLLVNETLRVNLTLRMARVTESVTIDASAINDSAALGEVIQDREMQSLPLNERNFLAFALLTPGTQMGADGSQLSSQGGGFSVNGAREQSNNFLLDGIDNNDSFVNQFSSLPPADAVEEFKIQSSGSTAEFGRSGGAQVNVVLKSGGNTFHGSMFEYLRNRHLDAKNYFDLPDCLPDSAAGTCSAIPKLDRNQFGGTLGGPLRRDRTFFFAAYEGMLLSQATTREATVPSLAQRSSALAAVPAELRNPAGLAVFNFLPAANVGADLETSNRYLAAPAITDTVHHASVKLDRVASTFDRLSFHYTFYDSDRFNPFDPLMPATNLPGYGSVAKNRGQEAGLTWTRVFQPDVVNEARFGFNRRRGLIVQENSGHDRGNELGFSNMLTRPIDLGYPIVGIAGYDGIGEPRNLPQDRQDNTFVITDNLAWNPRFNGGRHDIKLGGEFRNFHTKTFLDAIARGQWFFSGAFTGNSLQDLLLGMPTFALGVTGSTDAAISTTAYNLYIEDNWRITERVSLNMGLRWEYASPPVDARNRLSIPDLSTASATCTPQPACQFLVAGTGSVPRATYSPDRNNLAPRIALTWRPMPNANFAVRAGYGVYYDAAMINGNFMPRLNPPFFTTSVFANFGTSSIQTLLSQPALPQPAIGTMIARDFRDGYVQQWRLEVEQNVRRKALLGIAYVGSKGTALPMQQNLNQAMPGGAVPYPQFGPIDQIGSSASSSYHSLQARGRLHLNQLTALATYTWSKSIDNASALFRTDGEPGIPQNSFDPAAERGLSNFHAAHRGVVSFEYEFPAIRTSVIRQLLKSWSAGAIVTLQSGRPFTITRGIDQSHSGTATLGYFADRPNQISDPFIAGAVSANPDPLCQRTISNGGRAADRVRTPETWFNPCAFADPGLAFGNASRNSMIGPGLVGFDLSMSRTIRVSERRGLEMRVELFNALNRPNFDLPDQTFDSPAFARLVSANRNGLKPPRQLQIGVRYAF